MGRQRIPNEPLEDLKKMSWREYTKSYYWKRFSKAILDDEDVTCDICGCKRWNGVYTRGKKKGKRRRLRQFQIHHKHYDTLGEETREDFLILCASCHNAIHSVESLSSSRGGVWEKIYTYILEHTPWKYEKFKKKN